ncbi:T9SS type A sorting domain-containing protein [candidate division KSB1 bacterium]|nr:T9SS type A sorting domain-containing protein [candidate division KSB1 bacterium]MBL7092826.1 T9SS type A sorting domain-containing protein [candidate division KSB1 bacterium]
MKIYQFKILFAICLFFFSLPIELKTQVNNADKFINVLSSTTNNIILELDIPRFEKKAKLFQGKEYDVLNIAEFAQTAAPGKPQLPVKGFLFGIPSNGVTSVEILETESKTFSPVNIFYTPKITFEVDTSASRTSLPKDKLELFIDPKISTANQFYPKQIAKFEGSSFIREQRVGNVTIFPIQYNPVKKQIRYFERLKLKINFSGSAGTQLSLPSENRFPEPFEKLLSTSLINYDIAKTWRGVTAGLSKKLFQTNNLQMENEDWYKIIVNEDGIYRLDKTDLQNAGLDVSLFDPRKIKIFYRGTEIPIYISGEADGFFDDPDYIEFYGVAANNDYTYDNVYWLCTTTENGRRMTQQDGGLTGTFPIVTRSATRVHFERNNVYLHNIPNGEGEDHWFWDMVNAPNTLQLTVHLNNVINIFALPCKLKVAFRGITHPPTNPDHHTIVFINGFPVLDDLWDGQAKLQSEGNLNQGYIFNGQNTININLPGDTGAAVDQVYLNWIEIEYWQDYKAIDDIFTFTGRSDPGTRQFEVKNFSNDNISLYDITDSTNVLKIVDFLLETTEPGYTLKFQDNNSHREYLALTPSRAKKPKSFTKDNVTQLLSKNNQADYLIITHEDFYSSLSPLANFRQNQGLAVKTIKVQDVYDEFNYGVKNPQAIKDFLTYTYFNWRKPSPTYVLLVGDASFDYKHNWDDGEIDLMPTHLFESNIYNTETSSDNWYGCIIGEDVLPDLFIGRFPVRTTDQLNVLLNKTINYENNPEPGNWNKYVVLIADNPDDGGDFEGISEGFDSNYITPDFYVSKIYLNENYYDPDKTRAAIIEQISNGCLLVNYMGHGDMDSWAREEIFGTDQVVNLSNNVKAPLLVTMCCLNGFFHHPKIPYCIAEEFLKANTGGAVACFSPSGFGYASGDQKLGDGLFEAIFQNNDHILGSVTNKAKLSLYSLGSSFYDHISFFNLLGDPALQLNISPNEIEVESEWNLISLPRIPENSAVEYVLSSISSKWKKLLTYSNGTWIGADADIPPTFWTLKQMEWGQGYWLQTTEQGQIVVTGAEKSSAIPLTEGWNLIGNSTPLNHSLPEALSSINGNWKKLLHYRNGGWYGADALLPSTFWTLNEFKNGAGYWLEMATVDTLDISRVPLLTNNSGKPNLLNQMGEYVVIPDVAANKKNLKSPPTAGIPKINIENNYKLSVPKPSGFYGTVFLRNEPAPTGSKISAWINDVLIPPEISVTSPGKYDLMLLNGDDLQTPQIEGGKQNAQVVFKIKTPDGKIFVPGTKGTWKEGINHRLDLFALSKPDSSTNPISIKILVDDRVAGMDILDGDPISNKAVISAIISGGDQSFTSENVLFFLNSVPLDKSLYSYIPNTENSDSRGRIVYLPNTLNDGEYNLKVEVVETSLTANNVSENLSFVISNTLKFKKVVNFPNPMQDDTKFTYILMNDDPPDVSIKIYTVAGRLIRVIDSASNQIGYNETYWDGTDEFGDKIANGVYFYKITAKAGSEKIEVIERLVVMR